MIKKIFLYRCLVPECEHSGDTIFDPPWINASAPKIDEDISRCTRFRTREHWNNSYMCTETSFTDELRDCDSWVYDPDERTILSEVK